MPLSSTTLFSLLYKTNLSHVAVRLFRNRSQKTSTCGKNISDTLGCASCATFFFLPHFDIICDLLLNRCTATWNLFAKLNNHFKSEENHFHYSYVLICHCGHTGYVWLSGYHARLQIELCVVFLTRHFRWLPIVLRLHARIGRKLRSSAHAQGKT